EHANFVLCFVAPPTYRKFRKMRFFSSVQFVLHFTLVLVIGSYYKANALVAMLTQISCATYKTNEAKCNALGYVGDPLTGECISKCNDFCVKGTCHHYYCILTHEGIPTEELESCPYVYNLGKCGSGYCARTDNYCNEDYVISPYDPGECVLRCDKHSCVHGECSPQGSCVCHLGYRPDPMNPKTCKRIPKSLLNSSPCHEGYKRNANGDCRPACINQCKDVTCPPNIICKCPDGYEFNSTTSGCETKLIVDDFPETRTERMADLYTPISAFIITSLLVTVIALAFVVIKQQQAVRKESRLQKQSEQGIYNDHYYSTQRFDKKLDDDGILIENVELYGKDLGHQQQNRTKLDEDVHVVQELKPTDHVVRVQ
ncbi:hypothetical protein AMK59_5770, partial [Oryctes borbonicus]